MKILTHIILLWCLCVPITIRAQSQPAGSASLLLADSFPGLATNLSLTVRENFKIQLRWQSVVANGESFFAVERSSNGTDFSVISVVKNVVEGWMDFLDDAPLRGRSYYRVKATSGQGVIYSSIVQTSITGDLSCKFYPNPVDKVLIVRSEFACELLITDKFGKPVLSAKLGAGLKVVDVSTLEPGMYIINLNQREANRQITEKLIKK